MKRRFLSTLMALALALTLIPTAAMAADEEDVPAVLTETPSETPAEEPAPAAATAEDELKADIAAASAGGTVKLTEDVKLTSPIVITKALTLNLNGQTISNDVDIWDKDISDWSLISVRAGGNLTITGAGTLQAKADDCYAVDVMDGGVCTIENGFLQSVTEHTAIARTTDGRIEARDGERAVVLPPDTVVSMNAWGMPAEVFDGLEAGFCAFLRRRDGDVLKREYYLPGFVDDQVREGRGTVRVLTTPDQWHGVTYREDRDQVRAAFEKMLAQGLYPALR